MTNAQFNLVSRLPKLEAKVILAAAALLFLGLALHEHDRWIREHAALENAQQQARAQAGELAQRAQSAERAAQTETARADSLEAERALLAQRGQYLATQFATLESDERRATEQVATLPSSDVVARVAALLGKAGIRGSGLGVRDSQSRVGGANAVPSAATAPSEVTVAPSPQSPTPSPSGMGPNPEPRTPSPVLQLTDAGARKVETAFVELDACASERANLGEQLAGCRAETAKDAQAMAAQNNAANQLKQALAAKDQELEARQRAAQAELKAARGTFFSRLERTAKHVAIGVGIGVVIGAAAR